MSTFSNNLDIINKGVESLLEEREHYRNMQSIVNGTAFQDPKFNKSNLYRVKDYIHYYQNDWLNGNPLEPEPKVKWRCRLAGPFRTMSKAIIALRECGKLDMLDPIIAALEKEGIHLSVDAKQGTQDFTATLNAMDGIQSAICALADDRRDARDQAASVKQLTRSSYNNTTRSLLKIENEKMKAHGDVQKASNEVDEKLQDLLVDAAMEVDMYQHAQDFVKNGVIE